MWNPFKKRPPEPTFKERLHEHLGPYEKSFDAKLTEVASWIRKCPDSKIGMDLVIELLELERDFVREIWNFERR